MSISRSVPSYIFVFIFLLTLTIMDFCCGPGAANSAWYLQQALDEPLRWHVGSKIAAWASAIESVGYQWNPGGYLVVKNESKVFCNMSANGWWDISLNYHMHQIVGNKQRHDCKNSKKMSLFWLPTLFESCDPSLNCTHTPGDDFIILHTYLGKALTLTLQEVIQAAGGFGAWTPLQN